MKKPPGIVCFSIGEVSGIGVELLLKTFSDKRFFEFCTPVVYATNRVFSYYKKNLEIEVPINGISSPPEAIPGKINVVNIQKDEIKIIPGSPTRETGAFAARSLTRVIEDMKSFDIKTLVTLPIDKNNIQSEHFKYPGHTDFLQDVSGSESLMILMNDEIKIALLTGHIPLAEVSNAITIDLIIRKIRILNTSLKQDFFITKPKIALLSLNPHAGDNGLTGQEEKEIFLPAIEQLQNEDILVFGPYPADGFFGKASYRNFDAIMAAYHDQGLAPFKALTFGSGVNFTAGLPIVRTSPDHGTAYDIAGKNKASTGSLKNAIFTALEIRKRREEYLDLTEHSI